MRAWLGVVRSGQKEVEVPTVKRPKNDGGGGIEGANSNSAAVGERDGCR